MPSWLRKLLDRLTGWNTQARIPPPSPSPGDDALRVVALLNAERAAKRLGLLVRNPLLGAVAEAHAAWMAKARVLTHLGADGDPWTRIAASGYRYASASENIGWNERDAAEVVAAWMASPGHRANILGDFADVGAAVAYAVDGSPYWCCVFGRPA